MPQQPKGPVNYEDEPPILEGKWKQQLIDDKNVCLELGIVPADITKKFIAILTQRGFKEVSVYEDMAGAIFVLFLFGALLLLVSHSFEKSDI